MIDEKSIGNDDHGDEQFFKSMNPEIIKLIEDCRKYENEANFDKRVSILFVSLITGQLHVITISPENGDDVDVDGLSARELAGAIYFCYEGMKKDFPIEDHTGVIPAYVATTKAFINTSPNDIALVINRNVWDVLDPRRNKK